MSERLYKNDASLLNLKCKLFTSSYNQIKFVPLSSSKCTITAEERHL